MKKKDLKFKHTVTIDLMFSQSEYQLLNEIAKKCKKYGVYDMTFIEDEDDLNILKT